MGRRACCTKQGLNRGPWSPLEDTALTDYVRVHGQGQWRDLPLRAGLKRCGKSCRLRWLNYLRPDIKRGNISPDEEDLIIRLHTLLGNRWSLIAGRLPGRTDNEIKNYWNTNLSKRSLHGRPSTKIRTKAAKKLEPPAGAIRTKAVRCTKVIIIEDSSSVPIQTNKEDGPLYSSNHQPLDEGRNDLDLLRDFEIDDLLTNSSELCENSRDLESMPCLEPATCGMEHLLSYEFSDDWSFFLSGELDGS